MKERRSLKRWHLVYYLRIFDQETESLVGHVMDITTSGVKVVSEWPVPTGKRFQLWMEIPRETGEPHKVSFAAESLWSNEDDNPEFFNTGLRLIDPSERTVNSIRKLIDQLRLEDG